MLLVLNQNLSNLRSQLSVTSVGCAVSEIGLVTITSVSFCSLGYTDVQHYIHVECFVANSSKLCNHGYL